MKRRLTLSLLALGSALLLSGCATPEVRNAPAKDGDLSFNAKQGAEPSPSQTAPADKPAAQENNPVSNTKMYAQMPAMGIDTEKTYAAKLETSQGEIVISLSAKETPETVNNFVFLARDHFYDGTIFHRVIKDFMIQGGDPKGDGTGGPGYTFADEKFEGSYSRGTVAMANSGPGTNGSQFFIMHKDTPLPPNYVIFGHVSSGMEVVDRIANAPVKENAYGEKSAPAAPVTVTEVKIDEK